MMIKVADGIIPFKTHVSRWLGVWIDAHLTFKEQPNQCMNEARGAEGRPGTITKTYLVVPGSVWAIIVAWDQAVT